MKRTLAGLLLAAPVWALGQDPSNALLWSISGKGLPATSYVYGTVHSKDERAYTYVDAIERHMSAVSTVAGELDLTNARMNSMAIMGMMMMPDGKTLQDLYSKKDWKVVEAGLKADLGFMAAMVMRMKPFFAMTTMSETAMREDRAKMLDDHLLGHAKANGHRTFGLETVDEQMRAMDVLPLKEQAAMLLDHVRNNGYQDELEKLMEAYAQQDLATLMEIMENGGGGIPKEMEKALVTDRNKVMAHRMDSVMRADNGALFLIGAAHLPGELGVLKLLRAQGYLVEPVAIEAMPNEPLFPPAMFLEGGIRYTNDTLGYRVDMPGIPEQVGERSIGYKREKQGVLVIVDEVEGNVNDLDVAAVIAEMYGDVIKEPIRSLVVQGLEAQVVTVDMQGTAAEILMVQYRTTSFFLAAVDDNEERRRQVLDSFRLIHLPE